MKKITIIIALIMLSVKVTYAQDTERYTIKNLEVNDEFSNFGATYYGENQIIYASPRAKSRIIKNLWIPNEQPYLDLYLGTVTEEGEIIDSQKINRAVNTRYHESSVVYTSDMQTVYFTRDNYYEKDLNKDEEGMTHLAIYKATVSSPSEWTNIVPMPFNNKDYSVGHPTLSADGKTLYFVSDIPGSYGQTDIFKVAINEDGTYGDPVNLGAQVNTSDREMFPFMSDDGFLYFSSDRAGGMGDLDIYAVRLDATTSEVQNLGMPINSINDDFAFLKKKGADYGYFSSNRSEGHGDDDIYYFKELEPLQIPCDQVAEGIVTNKETGEKISGALVILFDEKGKEMGSQIVKEDAKFSFAVDCNSNYKVVGSKETYTIDSKTFTSNTNVALGLNLDLSLAVEPVVTTTPSGLSKDEFDQCQGALDLVKNIYFDLDKSFIRPDAALELSKVVKIMQRCPNIKVEASSHTDSRSTHAYNEALSQRRAQATVDFITETGGILRTRINAVGYGETRIQNRCVDGVKCSEIEHQINRRTQFDVSNY
ncbi:MAG: OmpA family protein [Flavobacteriaceae bacterium]|nr:OmpA family protein [Flavobacteriaceae bacterium]